MYFESLQALLLMDGHGVYVWSAYAVTLVVIAAVLIIPQRRRKRLLQQLSVEQRRARDAAVAGET
jgi:heme exporter protein D